MSDGKYFEFLSIEEFFLNIQLFILIIYDLARKKNSTYLLGDDLRFTRDLFLYFFFKICNSKSILFMVEVKM